MNILKRQLLFTTITILIGGCDSHNNKPKLQISDTLTNKKNIKTDNIKKESKPIESTEETIIQNDEVFEGYTIKYGYEKYDEEKYGFQNPGYIQVLKGQKVIFIDTIKGEGEIFVKSYGNHDLSGDKIVFTLNWGTQACDYSQHSRYYVITKDNKIHFLNEYWSFSGGDGYASRYYDHIFPEDSLGIKNSLLIVEGMTYHEHDQPDLSDTTIISFNGDNYKINKPTNNLEKAK